MTLYLVIGALALAVFTVCNLMLAEGRLKKPVRIVNILLYGLVALALVVSFLSAEINKSERKKYESYGGGLFDSVKYQGTENGYYVFREVKGFFSGGTTIAVPEGNATLPLITRLGFSPVIIYTQGEGETARDSSDPQRYDEVLTNAVKISPEYFWYCLSGAIITLVVLLLFNLILFLIIISLKRESGPAENAEQNIEDLTNGRDEL
ncbi:MAG: hypothetical protein IJ561_08955 [Ruminococcus sp.]|nr:hypothetical protein [Ruminococcus sp.]MBR1393947.1 hypothetical protein [Ruminococcus sp.]